MTTYISCTETAKLVRTALKEHFPGIKFSVKKSAGGSSIYVRWTDGPADPAVEHVVKFFEGATFDCSVDLKSYVTVELDGEEVQFGADYIICQREHTRPFVEAITRQFCKRWGIPMLGIKGTEEHAYADTNLLDYSTEKALRHLLMNTDVKDMDRAYAAQDEQEARERAAWKAQAQAKAEREAKERAEVEAKAEQERRQQEQAEFALWQHEQLNNPVWQQEQFKKWQQERERLAREEAARQEAERLAQEQARRERERLEAERRERERQEAERLQKEREAMRAAQQSILFSKYTALAYLGLPLMTTDSKEVMAAFRNKVKAAADGKGGYTIDMDFLVRVKERALSA